MPGKKRGDLEIIRDMLFVIAMYPNGAKRTRIMGNANLTYTNLKKYLTFLVDRNLVSEIEYRKGRRRKRSRKTDHVYILTEAGKWLAQLLDNLLTWIDEDKNPDIFIPYWAINQIVRQSNLDEELPEVPVTDNLPRLVEPDYTVLKDEDEEPELEKRDYEKANAFRDPSPPKTWEVQIEKLDDGTIKGVVRKADTES